MSTLEEKLEGPAATSDAVARAKLYGHLAYRGYIVTKEDKLGPLEVLVDSPMELQTWERDSKIPGDFQMRLVAARPWKFEKPHAAVRRQGG